ncbi:UNVERIFIED_CONTAM: transposase-like protein [Streptomyces graminofaciens]
MINSLPKSARPGAKKVLQEIYNAEDRVHAMKAVKDFERAYGAKWPKAVKKITDDVDELLALYDFPAEHWVHLRRPIRSMTRSARASPSTVSRCGT